MSLAPNKKLFFYWKNWKEVLILYQRSVKAKSLFSSFSHRHSHLNFVHIHKGENEYWLSFWWMNINENMNCNKKNWLFKNERFVDGDDLCFHLRCFWQVTVSDVLLSSFLLISFNRSDWHPMDQHIMASSWSFICTDILIHVTDTYTVQHQYHKRK